jgi:predicted transcriptional regulator of viral defense system
MNNKPTIILTNAEAFTKIADALAKANAPTISAYGLGKLVYLEGNLRESKEPKKEYKHLVDTLLTVRLLASINKVSAFHLFGHYAATPAEIACCVDPFAYVSHLSALEHHGLTDRFPKILYLTRPSASEWRKQADLQMQKDFGDSLESYKNSGLPRLTRPVFDTLNSTSIHIQERSQLGAFRNVSGTTLRVATIGRVFLDMLREPKLCGGIQHVLDIYKREAEHFLKLIIDEIDRHGQPIDKVRAGFVLTEVCKLHHETIEHWKNYAQRGGSRKLDPDVEFVPDHSETWKLSINVPSLT